MCLATPDQPDEGEELMSQMISEAGDPIVEPPREHVARLRSLLLARLDPPSPALAPRLASRQIARFLVGSGLVAALVVVALLALSRPLTAWAQVARAVQKRPWIHGQLSNPEGKQLVEQWLSSDRELGAERVDSTISFFDYKRKLLMKYVPAETAIYRLPQPPDGTPGGINFLRQLLDQMVNPRGPAKFPFPGMELIGQTQREIMEGDKKWLEIELTLRVAGGSRGGPLPMLIRVDPETKLPNSFNMMDEDGKRYNASIDYPDHGPADIYDLGVPRTATVIDRMVSEEVRRILAGLKAGRREFDDYCAFVVEQSVAVPPGHQPMTLVHRVWRKGAKWRVEMLRHQLQNWPPPLKVDTAWWKEHQREFEFIPRVICDGKELWYYYLGNDWKPGIGVPQPGKPDAMGQTIGPNDLLGPSDDPVIPIWCQDVLPEQAGHPNSGIGEPDNQREFLVELHASGGPPGTILLRGRDSKPLAEGAADYFRLWIDPAADYLSMRSEIRVHEPKNLKKVAFIGTLILEATEKSPQGHVYPTRSRQILHNGQVEMVRKFYMDFEAQLPDELFQPLK